jgi:pSer/pThr/pTyr-binding forkhead associated (FHA) protein
MARLVINPGSPAAWEVQLKPGANSLGRGPANDFQITDPSVSGSHCQIMLSGGSAVISDLGSTNGTFVNRAPVKEAALQTGQTIHLGSVELAFYGDGPVAVAGLAQAAPPGAPRLATAVPAPRIATAAPVARATVAAPIARVAAPAAAAPPPLPTEAPPVVAPTIVGSNQPCKFHPKSPARYYCAPCQRYYCEFCVTVRTVGGVQHKTCRQCAAELSPVEVATGVSSSHERFFSKLPGVFAYPSKGAGPFVLVVCSIVMAALGGPIGGFFVFLTALFYGYLFAFMQNIIHSTASEDEELPSWPAWDDLGGGALRLAGALVFSFGPAIGLGMYALWNEEPTAGVAMIPAMIFGCVYFPMALLAVAMKDSPLAGNPLVVLPAIVKVPLEYIVTVILLAVVICIERGGELALAAIFPKGMLTHRIDTLFEMFGARLLWNVAALYLLAVNMRILGLLYVTKKRKLGWFER